MSHANFWEFVLKKLFMPKKTTIKTIFLYSLLSLFFVFSFPSDMSAQFNLSELEDRIFNRTKDRVEQENSHWESQEEQMCEAVKVEVDNWNAIAIGRHITFLMSDTNHHDGESRFISDCVNKKATLAQEFLRLESSIEQMSEGEAKQALQVGMPLSQTLSPVSVEVLGPKQASRVKMTKAKRPSRVIIPDTEEEMKADLFLKEKRTIPNVSPIIEAYDLSSPMGMYLHPMLKRKMYNSGIDMSCARGSAVMATADGVVEYAGWAAGFGNFVKVCHGHGFATIYGHLSAINVQEGQRVTREQQIGQVGSTGRSIESCLHYSIILNGHYVNPQSFM